MILWEFLRQSLSCYTVLVNKTGHINLLNSRTGLATDHCLMNAADPGCLGSQDTFYVGTFKGVGRVYQQTYVDTYSKVALHPPKTPITAADTLNERVLPIYASEGLPVLRTLTDRGTEFCGKADSHDYQLYMAINDIEHIKTKVRHPQTNGICERFHKTILQEFYQPDLRRKIYGSIDELQQDLERKNS